MNGRIFWYLVLSCISISLQAGELRVGTIANAPPFSFQEGPDDLSGFEVDLMRAVCKRIKQPCRFKTFEFDQLRGALQRDEIDLAIASIIITPTREKQLLFSLPYKYNQVQFVVLTDSPLATGAQLKNKRIGLYKDSPERAYVVKQLQGQLQMKFYNNVDEMVQALKNKRVDAIVLEHSRALYWISNSKLFKPLGAPFRAGDGYGIAAKLNHWHLIQEVNAALLEMEKDGSYLTIYRQYF